MWGGMAASGWVGRALAWLSQLVSDVPAAARSSSLTVLPLLFAPRPPDPHAPLAREKGVHARPAVATFAFAARLKSVAAQNVPKSLKAARRAVVPPAGKHVPKRQPRVLKSYKSGRGGVLPPRGAVTRVAAEVIPFARTSVAAPLGTFGLLQNRAA